jgi:hypothetical protein
MGKPEIKESKYRGHWNNVNEDCMLCEMEKLTEWYLETRNWIVAEKLGGGPFVVYKTHKENCTDEEWGDMERIVSHVFDEFSFDVRMNHCPNHFHAHIITSSSPKVSPE